MAKQEGTHALGERLERFSEAVTWWTGTTTAFAAAVTLIVIWGILGPVFNYSNTWQLVINTGTTIITFLMVFLIQRSQNKDSLAIHLKLNEIVAALEGASNRLINVEDLTEREVWTLRQHYRRLVEIAKREDSLTRSHSIEEAEVRHRVKKQREKQLVASSVPASTRLPTSDPSAPGGDRP